MKLRVTAMLLTCVALAGCTNPFAKRDDFQTVVKSHGEALAKSVVPESFANTPGTAHFDGIISAKGQTESMQLSLTVDSKQHDRDSDAVFGFDGNIGSAAGASGSMSFKGSMEALYASGVGFLNVKSLQISGTQDNGASAMANAIMQQYGGKWLRLPKPSSTVIPAGQPDFPAIRAAFANHPIFAMSKDLGYGDGAYHYEVMLDKPQLLELQNDLKKALTGTGMDSAELADAEREVDASQLTGTLTVQDDNRAYGSFSGTFSHPQDIGTGTGKNVSGTVSYSNSSDAFALHIGAVGSLDVNVKKELTKASGTVTITDLTGKSTPVSFSVEKTLGGYSINVTTQTQIPTGEKVDFVANGKFETKKDDSVKIEAPSQSIDLQSILGGMMPGAIGGTGSEEAIPTDEEMQKLQDETDRLERDTNTQMRR